MHTLTENQWQCTLFQRHGAAYKMHYTLHCLKYILCIYSLQNVDNKLCKTQNAFNIRHNIAYYALHITLSTRYNNAYFDIQIAQ